MTVPVYQRENALLGTPVTPYVRGSGASIPAVPVTLNTSAPLGPVKESMMDAVTSTPSAMTHHVIGGSNAGYAGAGVAGMGIGGLALGGLGGLILGALMGNNNGGLFGGNRNNDAGPAVALGALEFMEQAGDIKRDIALAPQAAVLATVNAQGAIQTQLANANLNTLQSVDALGATLQTSATQALIQNLQSFNSLQNAAQTGFNTSNILMQNGFNSLQTQTMEGTADIKASLAQQTARTEAIAAAAALANQECCCEIKSAIQASTQAILDQNASFRMQDLQIENSNLRQTQVLRDQADSQTRTILAHLMPSSPVLARTV